MTDTGLEAVFMAHRAQIARFIRARGAIEEAEDILQELVADVPKPTALSRGKSRMSSSQRAAMLSSFAAAREVIASAAPWSHASIRRSAAVRRLRHWTQETTFRTFQRLPEAGRSFRSQRPFLR